jgi:hypothetical protein
MPTRLIALLAFVALLAAASPASAQIWGSGAPPRNGACFYQDANYRGSYFCVESGSSLNNLPLDVRDAISSIRVFGRADVSVFANAQFRGQSEQFDGDVQNLQRIGWNDMIRSIQVRGPGGFVNNQRPGFGAQSPEAIIRRAYDDILEREPDTAGMRLYRSRIIDDGWTEQQVREALRNSPEFRDKNTMTLPKARDIVRNAYLAVLQREPDPGAETYVARVMRDKWTQQDVERELRRSPEFLNRQR